MAWLTLARLCTLRPSHSRYAKQSWWKQLWATADTWCIRQCILCNSTPKLHIWPLYESATSYGMELTLHPQLIPSPTNSSLVLIRLKINRLTLIQPIANSRHRLGYSQPHLAQVIRMNYHLEGHQHTDDTLLHGFVWSLPDISYRCFKKERMGNKTVKSCRTSIPGSTRSLPSPPSGTCLLGRSEPPVCGVSNLYPCLVVQRDSMINDDKSH